MFPKFEGRDLFIHSKLPLDIDMKPARKHSPAINSAGGAVGGREVRGLAVDDLRMHRSTSTPHVVVERTSRKRSLEGRPSSTPPKQLIGIPLQGNGADIDIAGPGRRRFETAKSQLCNRLIPISSQDLSPRRERDMDVSALRDANAIGKGPENLTPRASLLCQRHQDSSSVHSMSTAATPTQVSLNNQKSTSQLLFRATWNTTHHCGQKDMKKPLKADPAFRVVPNDIGSGFAPRSKHGVRKPPVPTTPLQMQQRHWSPMFDKGSPEPEMTTQLASGSSLRSYGCPSTPETSANEITPRATYEFSPVRRFPDLASEPDGLCSASHSGYDSTSSGNDRRAAALLALARVRAVNTRVAALEIGCEAQAQDLYGELRYGSRAKRERESWVS